jgi:hypothetical protein
MLFEIFDKFFNELENLKGIYADMQRGQVGNLTIVSSRFPMTQNGIALFLTIRFGLRKVSR